MSKFDHAKIAIVAAPCLVGLGLFVFAFMQKGHFARDSEKRQYVEGQITTLLKQMEVETKKPIGRQAAVADKPGEESSYINFIRTAAHNCGVNIISWNQNPRPAPTTGAGGGTGKPVSPLLANITPLSGMIQIGGPYRSIIEFTRQLESADRLINLSSVGWNRADTGKDVRVSALITRYVIAEPAATPPPAANS